MTFDAEQARAAKAALAEKCQAIAALYLPEGWTVKYRNSLSGRCYYEPKRIEAPRPVTRKSLYIFLHECAHAHLHGGRTRTPRHVEEYEAEQWAHAKMREHGIPVPRAMTKRAKGYVRRKIQQAVMRGARRLDPKAVAWSRR